MRKFGIFLIIILLFVSCVFLPRQKNKPKKSVNKSEEYAIAKHKKVKKMIMTSSNSIEPSTDVKLYGCDFTIVINDLGDTTFWATTDSSFITSEGFKIGINWNQIPLDLQKSVIKMSGWGYYIKINSGWHLGFCEGNSCTDMTPQSRSIVKWIFKKKE